MRTDNTSFTMKATSPHLYECVFTQIKITYIYLGRSLELQHDILYAIHNREQNNTGFNPPKIYFPHGSNNCLLGFR